MNMRSTFWVALVAVVLTGVRVPVVLAEDVCGDLIGLDEEDNEILLLYVDGQEVYDYESDEKIGSVLDEDGVKFKVGARSFTFALKNSKVRGVVTETKKTKKRKVTVTARKNLDDADVAWQVVAEDGSRTVYAVGLEGEVYTATLSAEQASLPLREVISYEQDETVIFDNYGCGGDDGGDDEEELE